MKISSKLNELKPSDLNCNVFDIYSYDGLSMQELLCQFFSKINECIKVSNETIDLASWLVNEGLEIEVVKKLMLWLEDGTLENLINVNLFNTLNTKIENINTQLTHIETEKVDKDLYIEDLQRINNNFNKINEGYYNNRQNIHITPENGWMNDPHALCYYNGYYHCYFQYGIDNFIQQRLGWGHMRSKDLINWEQMPTVIHPTNNYDIWSGNAFVDTKGVAGLGENVLLVYPTFRNTSNNNQDIRLYYSYDGNEFYCYSDRPILTADYGATAHNFRDAHIIYDESLNKYVMVVAAGNNIHFYTSNNLIVWSFMFKKYIGDVIVECPSLSKFGNDYVLMWSENATRNNVKYIVGTLTLNDFQGSSVRIFDFGFDCYATTTFTNVEDKYVMSWVGNWGYSRDLNNDYTNYAGALTTVEKLELINGILCATPIVNGSLVSKESINVKNKYNFSSNNTFRAKINFNNIANFKIELCSYNENKILIDYNTNGVLTIDRTNSEIIVPNASKQLTNTVGVINSLDIIFDKNILQLYVNNGVYKFTVQTFSTFTPKNSYICGNNLNINIELFDLKNCFPYPCKCRNNLKPLIINQGYYSETSDGAVIIADNESDKFFISGTNSKHYYLKSVIKQVTGEAFSIILRCDLPLNNIIFLSFSILENKIKVVNIKNGVTTISNEYSYTLENNKFYSIECYVSEKLTLKIDNNVIYDNITLFDISDYQQFKKYKEGGFIGYGTYHSSIIIKDSLFKIHRNGAWS